MKPQPLDNMRRVTLFLVPFLIIFIIFYVEVLVIEQTPTAQLRYMLFEFA